MTTGVERIVRYYDSHKLKGEEVSQSRLHFAAIQYLLLVLQRLFLEQQVGSASSINLYKTRDPMEKPLSPDVMVVDGLQLEGQDAEANPSYYIGVDGPAPRIAFEISSKKTWRIDLTKKPGWYAAMGIKEYIAFDPNSQTLWTKDWPQDRLMGWRLDPATGQPLEIAKNERGWLWSEQLESWLGVDGQYLRLYTPDGQMRLSDAEADKQQTILERLRADTTERRLEAERRRAEKLAEALRRLGHDPDELFK